MPLYAKGRDLEELDLCIHTSLEIVEVKYKSEDEEKAAHKKPKTRGFLKGYASTKDLDEVRDIVHPAAFVDSLADFKEFPNFFWMHDPSEPIGIIEEASIDERGLLVKAAVFLDTIRGADAWKFIEGGAVKAFSIGYRVEEEKYDPDLDAFHLTKLALREVSAVTSPANRNAVFAIAGQVKSWAAKQTKFERLRRTPRAVGTPQKLDGKLEEAMMVALVAGLVNVAESEVSTAAATRHLVQEGFSG